MREKEERKEKGKKGERRKKGKGKKKGRKERGEKERKKGGREKERKEERKKKEITKRNPQAWLREGTLKLQLEKHLAEQLVFSMDVCASGWCGSLTP